jgi:hypothetical protein
MRWLITRDLIGGGEDAFRYGNVTGSEAQAHFITLPDVVPFRLYDDDGILYYEGFCRGLKDASEEQAFAPLDWAANHAGCTRMDYKEDGKWKTL